MQVSNILTVSSINYRFIVIRMVTAVSLFSVLGKANVWLDASTNGVLALGYRAFLLLTPLTLVWFGTQSLSITLLIAGCGLLIFAASSNPIFTVLAALLLVYGISIAGYLIKSEASRSKEGAAYNKIALNLGSLLAGLILIIPELSPCLFFVGAALVVLLCVPIAWGEVSPVVSTPVASRHRSLKTKLTWSIAGIVIGIKLFSVFSILPQAIIQKTGRLPEWYGLMLILNSAVVVLLQMPVMHLIERTGRFKLQCIIAMIIVGFVVLSVPATFKVHTFFGATVWLTILSIAECSLSYLDYFAARRDAMFVKEVSVGLGTGLTVVIMRMLPSSINTQLIGILGVVGIFVWLLLNRKDLESLLHADIDIR